MIMQLSPSLQYIFSILIPHLLQCEQRNKSVRIVVLEVPKMADGNHGVEILIVPPDKTYEQALAAAKPVSITPEESQNVH